MITIFGQVPSKSNGYKIGNNRLYKSKELKNYERIFANHINLGLGDSREMIKEKFILEVWVYFRSNRSDLDNAAKIILDCLQNCGLIENDRLCEELHMYKDIDKEMPRIVFDLRKKIK